jgi:hypothetical protein
MGDQIGRYKACFDRYLETQHNATYRGTKTSSLPIHIFNTSFRAYDLDEYALTFSKGFFTMLFTCLMLVQVGLTYVSCSKHYRKIRRFHVCMDCGKSKVSKNLISISGQTRRDHQELNKGPENAYAFSEA